MQTEYVMYQMKRIQTTQKKNEIKRAKHSRQIFDLPEILLYRQQTKQAKIKQSKSCERNELEGINALYKAMRFHARSILRDGNQSNDACIPLLPAIRLNKKR